MKSGCCTVMWTRRDPEASEMNHHQPHQRVVFILTKLCMWWDWKGVLYYELHLGKARLHVSLMTRQKLL